MAKAHGYTAQSAHEDVNTLGAEVQRNETPKGIVALLVFLRDINDTGVLYLLLHEVLGASGMEVETRTIFSHDQNSEISMPRDNGNFQNS